MKSKEKILSLVSCGALLAMLLMPIKTHAAALQANGSGSSTKKWEEWISGIRKMESQGGTLGLTGSSSLAQELENGKVKDSNNLDIHMQKNTEYGAMVLLSASSYGKPTPVHITTDGSLSTTTGNKSGVYMSLNKEMVSASDGNIENKVWKSAQLKYKNLYTGNYSTSAKSGDAILNWHGNTQSTWGMGTSGSIVIRKYSDSVFSYFFRSNYHESNIETGTHASRAVVVVGEGF